jgi:hypothetical protein
MPVDLMGCQILIDPLIEAEVSDLEFLFDEIAMAYFALPGHLPQ